MPRATCRQLSFAFTIFLTIFILTPAAAQVFTVNAAHYWPANHASGNGAMVCPEGLASAYGTFKVTPGATEYFITNPSALPKVLGGVKVTINGTDAELLYVGLGQINFIVPPNAPTGGTQTVTVTNADATTTTGQVRIEKSMPGLFSANFLGTGIGAASWTPNGVQPYPAIYTFVNNAPVASDVDAGTKQNPSYLILYGTGFRNAADTVANDTAPGLKNVAESVTVSIGGIPAKVDYAGKQGFYPGVDQLNVIIPPELASFGLLNVVIQVTDGTTSRGSNSVQVKLLKKDGQGNPVYAAVNIIRDLNIGGDSATGLMTYGDDLEIDTTTGKLYFSDIYTFTTTAPNTPITIDLRTDGASADPVDTLIIVRKVNGQTQSFYAADDQGGGYGNNLFEATNNSLLYTVVQDPGQYWVVVTSADVAPLDTGPYTVSIKSNGITPIAYTQTLNGTFAVTDDKTASGDYVDAFWFTGTEGQTVQATKTSSAFLPCVFLRDRNGDELGLHCPISGTTATINLTLPVNASMPQTRQFVLVATPLEPNKTGAYTMGLVKTAGLAEPGVTAAESRSENRVSAAEMSSGRRASSRSAMFRKAVRTDQ